jgi:Tfp pilus assembly protein PilO
MTTFLDKLNLRPQERRLVVIIGVVVFIVLNIWFVRPRFGDWGIVQNNLATARQSLGHYQEKILQGPEIEKNLHALEREGGTSAPIDNDIQLQRTIMAQANETKVTVNNYSPVAVRPSGTVTNEFFEEQSIKITVDTGEKELVEFLYNVGADSSMIRVRELDLKPADANRYRLRGSLTLAANYQKKPAVSAASPANTAKPAAATAHATPATSSSKKTAK